MGEKDIAPPGTCHGRTLTENRPARTAGSASFNSRGAIRLDVQDREAAELLVPEQRTGGEQMACVVQIREMSQMRVLKGGRGFVVELGSIGPQKEQ